MGDFAPTTSDWLINEEGTDKTLIGPRESRFTIGNGYLGTRGSLLESRRGDWPATYIAGVFDRRDATVVDLVNAPDWLATRIRVDGHRVDVDSCQVLAHRQALDLREATLFRSTMFEVEGRNVQLVTTRFASIDNPHIVAIRAQVTLLDRDGLVTVETRIDGDTRNLDRTPYPELESYDPTERWNKWTTSKHLHHVHCASSITEASSCLEMATADHDIRIGYTMALEIPESVQVVGSITGCEEAGLALELDAQRGVTYTIDKIVAITTSRDYGTTSQSVTARSTAIALAARGTGFDELLDANRRAWQARWETCDCIIGGDEDATRALRFNLYHLLIAANPADPTTSIGAKSLSGEGYKGHVFWDTEIFMLPFFTYTRPATAKALLTYRSETLDGARSNAARNGYEGAQFAWESADSGEETTPKWTHDGLNRIWTGEEELHITADIAYAIDTYVTATGDTEFMIERGAEIILEAARFWASRVEYSLDADRYELTRVIGPDEFHEHVDNSQYTNTLVKWTLQRAVGLFGELRDSAPAQMNNLQSRLRLTDNEVAGWNFVAERICVHPVTDGAVIEQFDGYLELDDVPIRVWDEHGMPCFPCGYDHFNCGSTTLLKQPDVLMLMMLLPDLFPASVVRANFDFYEARTLHKSSLSPAIHTVMGIQAGNTAKAVEYFTRSALVDLADNQGNTRDGIHAASAGGTWLSAIAGFGGFRVRQGLPSFDPWLPDQWSHISFTLVWRGSPLRVQINHCDVEMVWEGTSHPLTVRMADQPVTLDTASTTTVPYRADRRAR